MDDLKFSGAGILSLWITGCQRTIFNTLVEKGRTGGMLRLLLTGILCWSRDDVWYDVYSDQYRWNSSSYLKKLLLCMTRIKRCIFGAVYGER